MGLIVLLLVLAASGYHGDQLQTDPTDDQWFAKAVVNSYDEDRSFSDNFNSLLAILCPNLEHCTKNGTVTKASNDLVNVGKDHANRSSDFSEYSAIVYKNAKRLHGCCFPCSCDETCTEKGNCCPAVVQNSLPPKGEKSVIQECVFAGINSYIPHAHVSKAEAEAFSYYMVTDCFSANFTDDIAGRCRRPALDEFGPVFSPATKRIYKSKACAECNGEDHVFPWRPVVTFNQQFSLTGKRQIPSTLKELYDLLLRTRRFINLFYMPPDNMDTDRHTCVLTDEMNGLKNQCEGSLGFDSSRFLERACAAGGITYKTHLMTYRNVFCFLCSSASFSSKTGCDISPRNFALSFSAVLGSTQITSQEVQDVDENAPCGCREYYDHAKNLCRKLVCPPGEYFALCDCMEFLQKMNGMQVKLHLEINPRQHSREALERFTTKLNRNAIQQFEAGIKDTISMRWGPLGITYSTLFRETSVSDKRILKFHIAVTTTFLKTNDSRKLIKSIITTYQKGVPANILASPMTINLGPIYEMVGNLGTTALGLAKAINSSEIEIEPVESGDVDIGFVKTKTYTYAQTVSKLVYCQRVVLEEAEVVILRTRPRDVGVSPAYLPYVFREEDGSMCLEDFKLAFMASSESDPLVWGYTGIMLYLLVLLAV